MDLEEVHEWEEAVEVTRGNRNKLDGLLTAIKPAYRGRSEFTRPEKVVIDPRKDPKAMNILKALSRQGAGARRGKKG